MNGAKHIVLISSRLDMPGGIEKAVISLSALFAEKGHRVTLLVLDEPSGSFYPIPKDVVVRHENLLFGLRPEKKWFARKLDFLQSIWRLRKIWTAIEPDVIIATDYPYVVATVLSGVTRRAQCWSWEHHAYGWLQKSAGWERMLRYAYRRIRAVICLNDAEIKHYQPYANNIKVIANFVYNYVGGVSSLKQKTILTIGWLIHRKGIDLLLPAAKVVFAKHPDWKWKIIGTGEKEADVRRFIGQNNLEKNLILQTPSTADLSNEYLHSSVFVLPSRIEVFGLVLIEAMSHGLPCIALAKADGPASIIKHEENGLLVAEENSNELAEAVLRLVENSELRKEYGQNAEQSVKRFTPEAVYPQWEELLR